MLAPAIANTARNTWCRRSPRPHRSAKRGAGDGRGHADAQYLVLVTPRRAFLRHSGERTRWPLDFVLPATATLDLVLASPLGCMRRTSSSPWLLSFSSALFSTWPRGFLGLLTKEGTIHIQLSKEDSIVKRGDYPSLNDKVGDAIVIR